MFPLSILNPRFIKVPDYARELGASGHSCHHCRTHKRGDFLLGCNSIGDDMNKIKKCRKKYCTFCMRKNYGELLYYPDGYGKPSTIIKVTPTIDRFLVDIEEAFKNNTFEFNKPEDFKKVISMLEFKSTTPLITIMDSINWKCPACRKHCNCNACLGVTRGARSKNNSDEIDESDRVSDELPLSTSDKVYTKPLAILQRKDVSPFLSFVSVSSNNIGSNFTSSPQSISPINIVQHSHQNVPATPSQYIPQYIQSTLSKPNYANGNTYASTYQIQQIHPNKVLNDVKRIKSLAVSKTEFDYLSKFSATHDQSRNKSINYNAFAKLKQFGPIRPTAIRAHHKIDDVNIINFRNRNSRILLPMATRIVN